MRKLSVVSGQWPVVRAGRLAAGAETFNFRNASDGRRTTDDGRTSEGGVSWL
jgi:hypothetical protein